MPLYLSQHTLACLTRQGAAHLAKQVQDPNELAARRVMLNMMEGKMLVEVEAPSREAVEKWFAAHRFHFDWILLIEFESSGGELYPV
jgi:hypothetical protein